MTLTRDQIVGCDDLEYQYVDVPRWGRVRIRSLTTDEAAEYLNTLRAAAGGGTEIKDFRGVKAKLVALCLVNDDGERLFPEPDDVKFLGCRSAQSLEVLWQACMELNPPIGADHDALVGKSAATA